MTMELSLMTSKYEVLTTVKNLKETYVIPCVLGKVAAFSEANFKHKLCLINLSRVYN